jgi:hypothetical protein
VIIKSTIQRSKGKGESKDRGQSKEGRRIKGRLLGGLSEGSLLVLGLMEGLPDTGSHPAQMVSGSAIERYFLGKLSYSVCNKYADCQGSS